MGLRVQLYRAIVVAVVGSLLGNFHGRYTMKPSQTDEPNASSLNAYSSSNAVDTGMHPIQTIPTSFDEDINPAVAFNSPSRSWRDVRVYVGDVRRHLQSTPTKRRKRNREQRLGKVVLGLLRNKRGGYFIDLAAGDAIEKSNTLGLELKAQWTGLCIEPNPVYWYGLVYFRNCSVIAAVVAEGDQIKAVQFQYSNYRQLFFGGGVSRKFEKRSKDEVNCNRKLQYTVPLVEVLQVHGTPRMVDYLSVDLEGAEESIFQKFPWSEYNFSIVSLCRHANGTTMISDVLSQAGYKLLKNTSEFGGVTVWAHDSVISQLDLAVLSKLN